MIYNRRRELGFSLDFERFSAIQDTNLDAMVQEELNVFPRTGETNVIAGLRQHRVYITLAGKGEYYLSGSHQQGKQMGIKNITPAIQCSTP